MAPKSKKQQQQPTTAPTAAVAEEKELTVDDEVSEVNRQLMKIKLQKKQKQEEHEREIKRKQQDEQHAGNHHGSSSSSSKGGDHVAPIIQDGLVSGVKRSKPSAPIPAFQYFREENPKRANGWLLEKWKEMEEGEKRPYYTKAEEDKQRYKLQMEEYEKIHAKVVHHKVQKKDKKKSAKKNDDSGGSGSEDTPSHQDKESQESDEDHQPGKRLTKKGKKKLAAKLSTSPKPASHLSTKKNQVNDTSGQLSLLSASVKALSNQNRKYNEEDDDDEDEDDDEDDEDEDDEDDDEDEDDEEGEEGEEVDYGVYDDEEDEGYAEMKRGFKHQAGGNQKNRDHKLRSGKRWNS
ncbi:high mobility group box-containing protein [Cavenderia fasciculata]|uniref:High mobility group box-containing protein n=1 Tax=Cavenderia fasciculata TaxID=261658 RepID=F4PV17_CACFS|nr:high mobility group box-containing protein [Cavenderia fasciculata]EGG21133.1 high mobility group box-containing protein [Cavenderia fasciculata]|eukprot:XP_004358983.1 high mobility group box-containing protein [Cavenderia fasciculata]